MHGKRKIIYKGLGSKYCSIRLHKLIKDFIGGDLTDPELSPLITDDPILQQQCRTRGYMTIPIGGELRNVICGSTADHEGDELNLALQCPICHDVFCKRHLAEHLDEPIYTTPRGREIRVENPEIYIGKPDADIRTEMSSWDNQELNRAFHRVDILAKSMEEGGAGSGHYGHSGRTGERGGSEPSNVSLYHGTSVDSANKIVKEGIKTSSAEHQMYGQDTIWTSKDYSEAVRFGESRASSDPGEFAIVSISVPENELKADNVYASGHVTFSKDIPPDWVSKVEIYKGSSTTVPQLTQTILGQASSKSEEFITFYVPIILS